MYIIFSDIKGTRASRRKRKRKDILNKAAENELAEIGLEQQMLKEQCLKTTGQKSNKDEKVQTPGILKINPKTQASGKKSKQNVSLDLGAVIDALEVFLERRERYRSSGIDPLFIATGKISLPAYVWCHGHSHLAQNNMLPVSLPIVTSQFEL